jgi:hypothetical protein
MAHSSPWQVNVPRPSILVGCKGAAAATSISALAEAVLQQDLLGIMVWRVTVWCLVSGVWCHQFRIFSRYGTAV